jgi:hypothetical protein
MTWIRFESLELALLIRIEHSSGCQRRHEFPGTPDVIAYLHGTHFPNTWTELAAVMAVVYLLQSP